MDAWAHRLWQATLEKAVDLLQLPPRSDFATDAGQRRYQVLTQIPERLQVVGEADPLLDALDCMATVALQQRKHRGPNLPYLTIR